MACQIKHVRCPSSGCNGSFGISGAAFVLATAWGYNGFVRRPAGLGAQPEGISPHSGRQEVIR